MRGSEVRFLFPAPFLGCCAPRLRRWNSTQDAPVRFVLFAPLRRNPPCTRGARDAQKTSRLCKRFPGCCAPRLRRWNSTQDAPVRFVLFAPLRRNPPCTRGARDAQEFSVNLRSVTIPGVEVDAPVLAIFPGNTPTTACARTDAARGPRTIDSNNRNPSFFAPVFYFHQ